MNEKTEREAAEIRAQLEVAGVVLPASLRDVAYGTTENVDSPYLVVESAEGVTTFPGIQEGNGEKESAHRWFGERHREIEAQIQPPHEKPDGFLGKFRAS